jgi:type II secretory pathway component GspD/PulD (secretin)
LKATHTTSEKVRLEIFTELSHLDVPAGTDNLPGILSNEMKTQVDANYGVPLFLSGFLQQTLRENTQGLPFLQQLPVLGPLFGSTDYLTQRSELVAILYPYTAPPPSHKLMRSLQLPRGNLPPPREWLSPSETRTLENHPNYPWNVLQ